MSNNQEFYDALEAFSATIVDGEGKRIGMSIPQVLKDHKPRMVPVIGTNFYGTTVCNTWMQLLNMAAKQSNVKMHTMIKQAVDAIADPDEQLRLANKDGVTRSEIIRRLLVQAFPWLPEWQWPKRSATKATPKSEAVAKAKKELDATILQRAETESRQVYDPEVYAKLKAKALAHNVSVDDYIRTLMVKHSEKL